MANLSEGTRAQQVIIYLRVRMGLWVDGPEVANERVGGSEGLRRLREQRAELASQGLRIERRKHPDPGRDIWQYRMVEVPREVDGTPPPVRSHPDLAGNPVPARTPTAEAPLRYEQMPTRVAFGEAVPCPGCDGKRKRIDPITRKMGPCERCNGFGIVPVPRA